MLYIEFSRLLNFLINWKTLRNGLFQSFNKTTEVTHELLTHDVKAIHTHRNHLIPYYSEKLLSFLLFTHTLNKTFKKFMTPTYKTWFKVIYILPTIIPKLMITKKNKLPSAPPFSEINSKFMDTGSTVPLSFNSESFDSSSEKVRASTETV